MSFIGQKSLRGTGQLKETSIGMPELSMFSVLNQMPPLDMFSVLPAPVSAIR